MHTESLTKRITISLPDATFRRLRSAAASNVSGYVAEAIEDKLLRTAQPQSPVQTLKEMQEEFVQLGLSKHTVDQMKRSLREGLT